MTQEYYSIITNTGLAKHAAASIGSPLNLTHLAVGDSNGTAYNPVATATALQNERHRTSVTYVEIDESNPNQLIVEALIDETVGPFYVREVGIFDADGDLFAIGKFPETFKPNLPSGSGKRLYVRMILGFTGTPQVSLVQSENLNYDPNFSTNVFNALAQKLAKAQNLADLEDGAEARVNLGLEIGVNIQAFAENLAALAALISAANKIPYFTDALGAMSLLTIGTASGNIPLVGTASATSTIPGLVELLTNAELAAGTDTARAATAANILSLFAASSKSANGYARLPINSGGSFSEIIIQWGTGSGGGMLTKTLPIAFPNYFAYVQCAEIGASYRSFNLNILSTSQFAFESISVVSSSMRWFAIGY